jgi:hypothetical protein
MEILGQAFWEALKKYGGPLLIGVGLAALVFGPERLVAVSFIPGGILIMLVQHYARKRE